MYTELKTRNPDLWIHNSLLMDPGGQLITDPDPDNTVPGHFCGHF
jgi:hypothetical protein